MKPIMRCFPTSIISLIKKPNQHHKEYRPDNHHWLWLNLQAINNGSKRLAPSLT